MKNSSASLGATYPLSRLIFIGAKLSDDIREQNIKGIIAHELCHYAMRLIYENKESPYYEGDDKAVIILDEIVNEINKWEIQNKDSAEDESEEDDECDGIISGVFKCYSKDCHHAEIIVRPVHISCQFDDNKEKSAYLKRKYARLFEFFVTFVLPELIKFNLIERDNVMKFNKIVGVVTFIEKNNFQVTSEKDIKSIFDNENAVIVSNVPKLLLTNIYEYLKKEYGKLAMSRNIFINPEILNNETILNDLKEYLTNNFDLKVFVDCIKEINIDLLKLQSNKSTKFYFIISYKDQQNDMFKNLNSAEKVRIDFTCNDLATDTQKLLLDTKLNFQCSTEISLLDLISGQLTELSDIVDDQLLNLLVDKSQISINTNFFEELNNDKNFNCLFQQRQFFKHSKNNCDKIGTKMTQEELLIDVRNKKYVLISDIAGTGKSWALKYLTRALNQLYPNYWISYIDLKQFSSNFKSDSNIEFDNFMTEVVLKTDNSYEKKIFQKLYQNGKVLLLFDGFDEICPNYFKKVTKLFENFEYNSGNQLWISTRDHFEADLKEKLEIDAVYKLNKFTINDGIQFISSIWGFNDSLEQNVDVKRVIKISQKHQNYKNLAQKLIKKVSYEERKLIGLPQFYKMVATVFENNKNPEGEFSMLKIYSNFVAILIERWEQKGELRMIQKNKCMNDDASSYGQIHQYFAMKSLYPDEDEFCDLEHDADEWPDEEIIGCGMLAKINENYLFPHETLREYFVAKFIYRIFKKGGHKDFPKYFFQFLCSKKYEIVRVFLNDFLAEEFKSLKISSLKKNIIKKIDKLEDISEIFREDLEFLFCMLLKLLENSDYEKVKKILDNNIKTITSFAQNSKLFTKFYEFFVKFLNLEDLKKFTFRQNLMRKIATSNLSSETFTKFCTELSQKCGDDFVQNMLKTKDSDDRNLMLHLCSLQNYGKFKKIFNEIFRKYFERSELLLLFQEHDKSMKNILHIAIESKNIETLKIIWSKMQLTFTIEASLTKFQQLIFNKCSAHGRSVLHYLGLIPFLQFHKSVWLLLLKSFPQQEDLKNLIFVREIGGLGYLHLIISKSEPDIIEFTFRTIKEEFSRENYEEILNVKDSRERNLLQISTTASKNIQVFKFIWGILKDFYQNSPKFVNFLYETDRESNNLFQCSVTSTSSDILDFLLKESKKVLLKNELKKLLSNDNYFKENLFHISLNSKKSLNFYKTFWNVFHQYFEHLEILEILQRKNYKGKTSLKLATEQNSIEIIKFLWSKMKKCLFKINYDIEPNLPQLLKEFDKIFENKNNSTNFNLSDCKDLAKYLFEIEKLIESCIVQKVAERNSLKQSADIFFTLKLENLDEYCFTWEHLFFSINLNLLNFLITYKNLSGKNFMHYLVIEKELDIIEQTFVIFKEKFDRIQYNNILQTLDSHVKNLLQVFIMDSDSLEIFVILWNFLKQTFENDDDFVEFLEKMDKTNENIFISAVTLSKFKIFEFMIEELERSKFDLKIKQILKSVNNNGESMLQMASKISKEIKTLESFENFWKLILKFLNFDEFLELISHKDKLSMNLIIFTVLYSSQEILEFVFTEIQKFNNFLEYLNYYDTYSQNVLHYCAHKGKKEMLKFLWTKIEEQFNNCQAHEQFKDYVMHKNTCNSSNFLHLSAASDDIEYHEVLLNLMLKTFDNQDELVNFIIQENAAKSNYIDLIIFAKKSNILELIIKTLQENLSRNQFIEFLQFKNFHGRNLLMRTLETVSFEACLYLWKYVRISCKTDKAFLSILNEKENSNGNIFNIIAHFSSSEVFEFLIGELENITSKLEIRKFLSNMNLWNRKPLQDAAYANRSPELHKSLWIAYRNYFEVTDVLEIIRQNDSAGNNLIRLTVAYNTKEIVELTFNEIVTTIESYENKDEILKEILRSKSICGKNLLQIAACVTTDMQLHQFLWSTFQKKFNYEELLELIKQPDFHGGCIFQLAANSNTKDIAEFIYQEILKATSLFDNAEDILREIIEIKDFSGLNIHQRVLFASKDYQTHQFIWNKFREIYKSDQEFVKYLNREDDYKNNIFQHSMKFTTGEILEFIFVESEKIASRDEIRILFSNQDVYEQNIIFAAKYNQSKIVHEHLWAYLRKYFELSEILKFILYENKYGRNIIFELIGENAKDILIVTWNEIKSLFTKFLQNDKVVEELDEILENFESLDGKNSFKFKWIEFEQKLKTKFVQKNVDKLFEENIFPENLTDFHTFSFSNDIEIHKDVLINLLVKYKDRDKLKELLIQKDIFGDNYIHFLVSNAKPEIIKFLFKALKENFNQNQGKEILTSKCKRGRNLFHIAIRNSKDIGVHKTLWNGFQEFYKTSRELLDILTNLDHNNRNIFHYNSFFSTGKVLEFYLKELENLKADVKSYLSVFDIQKCNILQYAGQCNETIDLHECLWKILKKYFEKSEILSFIKNADKDGDSLLLNCVIFNTKDVVEFTWNQIKLFMDKEELIEYLKERGHENKDVREMSLDNKGNKDVNLWIENLLHEYGL